ncbi:LuxR family transcriptional regulator [Geodermatophilus sabuli]|uniref:LuxR family transcriptional regulator n=1 Tax=Geodermatophilus sabuli TaxID=1564158 RepID=A0A7K3VW03_9ACTN|nr:LuxR C-terminal-related transcriptional regulator [Geodermatophilus sabuli]NEK56816.1 LuxR family transcriptional regulator [Geodermatophilus sabuli]
MRRASLPIDLTNFVGRRQELTQLLETLRGSRLVTLTGPGGVGKTRLAKELARRAATEVGGAVFFAELAEVSNPDNVPPAIALAMGVTGDPHRSALDELSEKLQDRRVLLVLDNCEHLSPACGRAASVLLRCAPGLRIVATSREPLGILGELTWSVPPLALPRDSDTATPAGDAVDLFLERARPVLPGFAPSDEELGLIGELCRRLDGMPLAIELAAVRIRSLPLDQILSAEGGIFDVLDRGNRDAPARHQTLRNAIQWSYDLCTPQERLLWQRLSAFSGSFDLQAAKEVSAGGGIGSRDVVRLLGELVEKSVVTLTPSGGGQRYRLLESIRMFGLERCSDVDALRRRHRDHYLRLAEEFERSSMDADQFEVVRHLDGELANFRAALEYSFADPGERLLGLRLAGALWFYWNACGNMRDGCLWLRRGLAVNPEPSPERAKALWVLGWYTMLQGDNADAREHLEECRLIATDIGDDAARIRATQFRGTVEQIDGNLPEALALLEETRRGHETPAGDRTLSVLCAAQIAFVLGLTDRVDEAHRTCDAAVAEGQAHGERWATSWVLWVRGLAYHLGGDTQASIDALRDSIDLKASLSDWMGAATCAEVLAWNFVDTGQPEQAARLMGIGRMLCGAMGGASPLFGTPALVGRRAEFEQRARDAMGAEPFNREFEAGLTMEPLVAVAVALGRESGKPVPVPHEAWDDLLTTREIEISRLVAEGLSNNEIAESLTISRRTVEGHLNRILAKLNLRSRSQVTAWVIRRESLITN